MEFLKGSLSENEENFNKVSNYIAEVNNLFTFHYGTRNREAAMKLLPFVDPNFEDGLVISKAAARGDEEMLVKLIQKGANVRICDNSALLGAVNSGSVECVRILLDYGADPESLIFREINLHNEDIKKLVMNKFYERHPEQKPQI